MLSIEYYGSSCTLVAVIDLYGTPGDVLEHLGTQRTRLLAAALRVAWFRQRPDPGLIFLSDRGSRFCSHEFQSASSQYGMKISISRRGKCFYHAPTESLWGSFKVGRPHGARFETRW